MGDYASREMDAAEDEATSDECEECGADLWLGEHFENCTYWEEVDE